jgi:predicted DNA binding CopG/RHH family protein
MNHKNLYSDSIAAVDYQKAKIRAHYDKLCQLIDDNICSKQDIKKYFEDKHFKRYYHNHKKNGQGTL